MLFHKHYTGQLKRLGNARTYSGQYKYSVIQIGSKLVKNIWVSDLIGSYLDVGRDMEITVMRLPLSFYRKGIVILKTSEISLKEKLYKIIVSAVGLALINFLILFLLVYVVASSNLEFETFITFLGVVAFFEILRAVYILS